VAIISDSCWTHEQREQGSSKNEWEVLSAGGCKRNEELGYSRDLPLPRIVGNSAFQAIKGLVEKFRKDHQNGDRTHYAEDSQGAGKRKADDTAKERHPSI